MKSKYTGLSELLLSKPGQNNGSPRTDILFVYGKGEAEKDATIIQDLNQISDMALIPLELLDQGYIVNNFNFNRT